MCHPAGVSAHPAPGGPNDMPRMSITPPEPLTPLMTVHVYTSACKLHAVYTVAKPKGKNRSWLIGGRVITRVIGNHILRALK